jgi:ribonuclease E
MGDEESTDTTTEVAAEAVSPQEQASVAAPRRRRAAARAAGPPKTPETPETPATGGSGGTEEAADPPAPRRRVRKRAAAPEAPAAEPAPDGLPEKPKRGGRTRKKAEPQPAMPAMPAVPAMPAMPATEVDPQTAAPAADEPAGVGADAGAAAVTVGAEATAAAAEKAVGTGGVDAPDGRGAPATATTAAFRAPFVLFQPPTPLTPPDRAELADSTRGEAVAEGEDEGGDDDDSLTRRRRRRRGGRGRRGKSGDEADAGQGEDAESTDETGETDEINQPAGKGANGNDEAKADDADDADDAEDKNSRRRRRRRRRTADEESDEPRPDDPPNTVVRIREPRPPSEPDDVVQALKGSTRLEAKRQRRREGREQGRRRAPIITEAEFLARREAVERVMVVREAGERTQIAVLEDGVLVEHYVDRRVATSYVGNVYLGKVQNVLASMEAAFVDIGKGRNAVLYAGEVNWDAAGLEGQPKRIEEALKSGQSVLVQVTKDPIGHKGARLTSQISLPGRYLVYVPDGSMTGISRKLPDKERARLKSALRKVLPEGAGVIVRTAAEGASEEELAHDVARLEAQWESIRAKARTASAPALLHGEPDLTIRVIRDIFNEDFSQLVMSGDGAAETVEQYVGYVAPDLMSRVERWRGPDDVFAAHRVDEQLLKGLDRKVWLPSGGSLVIDRTEAMTVIDVNTGKFTGKGGNLEETVTKNNLEAAEEIVRQLRLRDIGGIIVIDFIDMVLESNRELVLRRLLECLGRDRTRHQVAEVTSLGLVQMTRKRVGQGLLEAFSHTCEQCGGRGVIVHMEPVESGATGPSEPPPAGRRRGRRGEAPEAAGDADAADDLADAQPEPDEPKTLVEALEPEVVPLEEDAAEDAGAADHGSETSEPADNAAEPKRGRRTRKRAQPVA